MPLPPIIHEDAEVLAFDKPSGLLVAPDRWDKQRENLMGLVHERLGREVANVHRLDADTSGLLLCTKNKRALDILSGQFQSKTVAKRYAASALVLPYEPKVIYSIPTPKPSTKPISKPADRPTTRSARKKRGNCIWPAPPWHGRRRRNWPRWSIA